MTPEDKEQIVPIIELAVTRGVAAGVSPLWDRVNSHETAIALTGQRVLQVEHGTKEIIATLDEIRKEQYDGRVELKTEIVAQEAALVDARQAVKDGARNFIENPVVVAVLTAAIMGGLYAYFTFVK